MKLGMPWMGVALDSGEVSQASKARALALGPMLGCMGGGRLKESMGESWSFMVLASIFSWRRHLALRFWNHTWRREAGGQMEDKTELAFINGMYLIGCIHKYICILLLHRLSKRLRCLHRL